MKILWGHQYNNIFQYGVQFWRIFISVTFWSKDLHLPIAA